MPMTKNQLKEQLKKLLFRQQVEENSVEFYKSLTKKELKAFVNQHGGFTKGQIQTLSFVWMTDDSTIPQGAFGFEAILSDESINMNGYRILLSARQQGFHNYFSDYEGLVYLQHDMDQPIGKTLDIGVDEGQQMLFARWYAYDDLTDHRISRGLVRDISTGHIPLEILYINKETNEEKTPDEYWLMMCDMIDRLWDEGKERSVIREAIVGLQELWIETHTKVQIVEYSFVSVWANKNAHVKTINNTLDKLTTEIPEDVSLIRDSDETPILTEAENQEKDTPNEDRETNNQSNNEQSDVSHGDECLENEGETPEANTDEPETNNTENVSDVSSCNECNLLRTTIQQLEAQITQLTDEINQLKAHQTNRRVLLPMKTTTSTFGKVSAPVSDDSLKASVSQLLK